MTEQEHPTSLSLDVLRLDAKNPRLPAEVQGSSEDFLLEYIAEAYNAMEVARSIARHGYFASEPLIVIPDNDEYIVVEGNRRLVALRILADPSLAESLDDADEWRGLAEGLDLPERIPVVVVPDRKSVAPIIGYRHISGIEPWEPYAKARFIAGLVAEGTSFEEVGNIVGERATDIAAQYRNYAIVEQSREKFGLDTGRVVRRFGVFTRSMNSLPLRVYVGAPAPSSVETAKAPVPADKSGELRELFSWLFGDDDHQAVISESRDITELGTVVASDEGLSILKETRDLEAAFIAAGGLRDRLVKRLTNARTNLVAAREDLPSYADDEEVQTLIEGCAEALAQLKQENGEG